MFNPMFNYVSFELPKNAVLDCHHQGACNEDVRYWQEKLNLNLDRGSMISELKEFGAWSEDELNELEDNELEEKLIWIGAANIQEDEKYSKQLENED